MKISIFSFLVLSILAFSSCEKSDIKDDKDKNDCFELVYPITYIMPDGTQISGTEEELNTAMKAWYENHPDSKAKPALEYPVEIIIGDLIKTINDEAAMIAAKKDCNDETDELEVCEWDESLVAAADVWVKHIIEPLVIKNDCGCPIKGVVKYVKPANDFAYEVYYGEGECDQWAYLVTYFGNTSDKKPAKCKFKLDCDPGN